MPIGGGSQICIMRSSMKQTRTRKRNALTANHLAKCRCLLRLRVIKVVSVSTTDEISAGAIIQAKYRVCWGPHQTRKDTKYRIETLYTRDVARETRLTAHRSYYCRYDDNWRRLKQYWNRYLVTCLLTRGRQEKSLHFAAHLRQRSRCG